MDKRLKVEVLAATDKPQTSVWYAKQDYMWTPIAYAKAPPSEKEAGEWVVETLCKKKHMGPLEHPQIQFNVIGWPHSTMVQFRTHRTGISFDVASGRYCSKPFIKAADLINEGILSPLEVASVVEDLFYLREVGEYTDRKGKRYKYTHEHKKAQINRIARCLEVYRNLVVEEGFAEEQARDELPWNNVRQNFVMSCNLRTVLHLFAMRSSREAQLECQLLCDALLEKGLEWAPEVIGWYNDKFYKKAFIAP